MNASGIIPPAVLVRASEELFRGAFTGGDDGDYCFIVSRSRGRGKMMRERRMDEDGTRSISRRGMERGEEEEITT